MALLSIDCRDELGQVTEAIGNVVNTKLSPMIGGAIAQASAELGGLVKQARVLSTYRTNEANYGSRPRVARPRQQSVTGYAFFAISVTSFQSKNA